MTELITRTRRFETVITTREFTMGEYTLLLTSTTSDNKKTEKLSCKGSFEDGNQIRPVLVDDQIMQAFREHGYPYVYDPHGNKDLIAIKNKLDAINGDETKLFWAIRDGDHPYRLLMIRYYDHSFFDMAAGKNFKTRHFNYIDGRIDNGRYKLDQLHDHLKGLGDPNLSNITCINSIPHYNASEKRNRSFSFNYFCESPFKYDSYTEQNKILSELGCDQFKNPVKEGEYDD